MPHGLKENIPYVPVSIIIPVLNNLEWTKQCLESVFDTNARECEIIIIDNASTDGSLNYLESLKTNNKELRIISNPKNIGVAASWNQGIRESVYNYVCIINNDIKIFTKDWLYKMQSILANKISVYWTSPRTCYTLNPKKALFNPSHYEQLVYSAIRTDYVVACCFMCPKSIFNEIGFFDENFEVKYYEDLDFIARILSSNKKVKMTRDVLIYHGVGKTSRTIAGGENNENYYQSKWGGTPYDILAMQPGRKIKSVKHFN